MRRSEQPPHPAPCPHPTRYLLFQDNLDSQKQPDYIQYLKEWAVDDHKLPPNETDQVQPIDRGLGRQVKIYLGQQMDEWCCKVLIGYLTEAPEALTGRPLILVGCGPTGPDLGRKSSEACRREPRNARRSRATSLLKVLPIGYLTEAPEALTEALTGRTLILVRCGPTEPDLGRRLLEACRHEPRNAGRSCAARCSPPSNSPSTLPGAH